MSQKDKTYIIWRPQCEETRADAKRIEARSLRAAVEQWAADFDEAQVFNPSIVGGESETVLVALDEEGSEVYVYKVSGEIKYEYEARRVA